MLKSFRLTSVETRYRGYVPPRIQPLIDAAAKGEDLIPIVETVTQSFGFDAFNCGISTSLHPDGETLFYVFTTMPKQWLAIYDQRSYIEVDPRVHTLLDTLLPMVWDQDSLRGKDPKVDEFLDAGLQYGLGSGVAIGFVDACAHPVMLALNSKSPKISAKRKAEILENIGEVVLFGHFFHEIFTARVIKLGSPPRSIGAPLSARERECLKMAARGLTSEDIGYKLGIKPRTVQFHFDSIRSKLAAVSRQEAVAIAAHSGII